MISKEQFQHHVQRAALAPTVHNTQPARWVFDATGATLFCDTDRGLRVGDPEGRDAGLSCGAVLEAMVLSLSADQIGADIDLIADADLSAGAGLVAVAHIRFLPQGAVDRLHLQLENRFTWRGPFDPAAAELFGWTRKDARLVLDQKNKTWLAQRNDAASLDIMRDRGFRKELMSWMRLSPRHGRNGLDGMNREALRMSGPIALSAPMVLGPLWPVLDRFGATKGITSEAEVTSNAPVIALFHRDKSESSIATGRAYLRMCLEAASLGMAGWPMAALSDHPQISQEVCARFGIGPDRRFVQAIRFGKPTGQAPERARRPLDEVLIDG